MAKDRSRSKDEDEVTIPRSEKEALFYESKLCAHIQVHKGRYLREEDGSLHIILGKQRIPLTKERNNWKLARLVLSACNVTTLTQGAQAAIQRLEVKAQEQATDLKFQRFSAVFLDRSRLYIPVNDGRLLLVTEGNVVHCENGCNQDQFWVEHPYHKPFEFSSRSKEEGLALFESLLVETQACAVPSMRWLVAMHEGFFPFVRSICTARFLLVHLGGTQQGKTSGAQRFTILHGLGEVKGDFSVAALANSPDLGLLVLDNKEQANFDQPLIDFCLFLATGAERGRSQTDGQLRRSSTRPVGVITSIEGVWKPELQARCVEVHYQVSGCRRDREDIEENIQTRRNEIVSGMIPVFQAWLRRRRDGVQRFWKECPLQNFDRHLSVLAELLCAYGEVAGKPEDWARHIVGDWTNHLREGNVEEEPLEYPIGAILENSPADAKFQMESEVEINGRSGRLYVTEAAPLLQFLKNGSRREDQLPKCANGLSRRLRTAHFRKFKFVDEDNAPQIPQLKRTARRRPIGFFVPDDDVTAE